MEAITPTPTGFNIYCINCRNENKPSYYSRKMTLTGKLCQSEYTCRGCGHKLFLSYRL